MSDKINELKNAMYNMDQLVKELNSLYIGKNAKIVSTTYNGQPYGRSKPKLTGKIYPIKHIFISTGSKSEIGVFLEGQLLSLRWDDIEVLEN